GATRQQARERRRLRHREEITRLDSRVREKGLTIVPLSLYFLDGRAKVEIALARGKREWDKRQALRERQDTLEARRAMRRREEMQVHPPDREISLRVRPRAHYGGAVASDGGRGTW